jgi:hypothetical protein
MDDKTIIATLQDWSDALSIQSFANDAIRTILWTITKGLGKVLDAIGTTVQKIYSLMGFVNYSGLSKYMKDLQPLVFLLLIISIAFFGFYLLTRKSTAQINIFQSLIAIVLIITVMPILSMKIGTFSQSASKYAREKYTKNETTFTHIVDSNVIDLTKIDNSDKKNFPKYKTIKKDIAKKGNNIKSASDISAMNINEYMNYSDNDYNYKDVWQNELSTDGSGKATLQKMNKGHILDVLKDYYYRYHVNWGTMIFSILAMAVALLFTALKSARIIFEIGFHQILGPFVAVSDLATGQRIKEFIRSLLSLFAALFLLAALMGVYYIGIDYLNSKDLNAFTLVICELALAWMVIDGPNVVERIIGIDIGLKNAHGMLVGMWAAGRTAKGAVEGAGKAVSKAGKIAKNGPEGLKNAGGKAAAALVGHKGKEKMDSVAQEAKDAANAKKEAAKTAIGRATGGYGMAGAAKNGFAKAKGKAQSAFSSGNAKADATGTSKSANGASKADAKANAANKSAAAKKTSPSIANESAAEAKAKAENAAAKKNASSIANAAAGMHGSGKGDASNAHLAQMDKERRGAQSTTPSSGAVSQAAARNNAHNIGSGVNPSSGGSISTGAQKEAAAGNIPSGSTGGSGLSKGPAPNISNSSAGASGGPSVYGGSGSGSSGSANASATANSHAGGTGTTFGSSGSYGGSANRTTNQTRTIRTQTRRSTQRSRRRPIPGGKRRR